MAIKTRTDLKGQFANGKILNQLQFHDLIDSMLNKRDDSFMGQWIKGVTYTSGNVVIYNHALWEVPYGPPDAQGKPKKIEICSCLPPGDPGTDDEWTSLIVPVEDNDWVVHLASQSMYAKVFECVGIGRVFDPANGDPPDAKLEVVKENAGRFLVFPKPAESPTLSLIQIGDGQSRENAYFLIGLDNQETGFTTDAPAGYVFRRGGHAEQGSEDELNYHDGDILMVIKPTESGSGLARVGISTANPTAMLDITDRAKGQFLFNPEDKKDPAFTIINLDPSCDKNYLSTGVGEDYAVFITDAPKGFIFKDGDDYGNFCALNNINQGAPLMVIQTGSSGVAHVGIGTEEPCTMLHVTDGVKGAFHADPNTKADPVISIVNLPNANYLAAGVGAERSTLTTDTPKGYVFRAGAEIIGGCKVPDLDEGKKLVVMLPNGNVGIGTESTDPIVRLEVTDDGESGRFMFNLDDKKVNPALAIVNTRPNKDNYFTLGADNQTAVLVTDSKNGFVFKHGALMQDSNNTEFYELDVTQGDALLKLLPPASVPSGGTVPAQAVFFPNLAGKVGVMRSPEDYQLDINGQIRAYNVFTDTDQASLSNEQRLDTYFGAQGNETALDKLRQLRPIAFDWDQSTGYHNEGKQFGLKAQEVQDVLPEAVKDIPGQRLSLSQNSVDAVHIQATQILAGMLEEQQRMIDKLKAQIIALGGTI